MHGRGYAWQRGVHGRGACMAGGHVWQGVCAWLGAYMAGEGGQAWQGEVCVPQQILRDTVNERAVRILLECILVLELFLRVVADAARNQGGS